MKMPSPYTRVYTDDEEIAFDSGFMEGAAKERQKFSDLLTLLRAVANNQELTDSQRMNVILTLLKEGNK